ncbi:acyl-CoA thioester hydrolase [Gammaproteobacteria bacterium]|nr:acyl-CoA thioester hydrolase [Gammaproteobacteria bacterium]
MHTQKLIATAGQYLFPVCVYYEDTDAGGVVYHANYLNYMERARTQWLMSLGFNLKDWAQEQSQILVVRSLNIEYIKPAVLLDELVVISSVSKHGKVRLHFSQNILRGEQLLIKAQVEIVCINSKTMRPTALPEIFSKLIV